MATLARVSDYLMMAECREPDPWHRQDYRIAGVMVAMAEEGRGPSYEKAFIRLFGKQAKDITWWWRDREALWRLAEIANRACPLALANQAQEILGGPEMVEIPDLGYVPLARARALGSKAAA